MVWERGELRGWHASAVGCTGTEGAGEGSSWCWQGMSQRVAGAGGTPRLYSSSGLGGSMPGGGTMQG